MRLKTPQNLQSHSQPQGRVHRVAGHHQHNYLYRHYQGGQAVRLIALLSIRELNDTFPAFTYGHLARVQRSLSKNIGSLLILLQLII